MVSDVGNIYQIKDSLYNLAFTLIGGIFKGVILCYDYFADLELARLGVLCILLCIALGIANLLHVSIIILFSAICL